jgi:hypothetical protein
MSSAHSIYKTITHAPITGRGCIKESIDMTYGNFLLSKDVERAA